MEEAVLLSFFGFSAFYLCISFHSLSSHKKIHIKQNVKLQSSAEIISQYVNFRTSFSKKLGAQKRLGVFAPLYKLNNILLLKQKGGQGAVIFSSFGVSVIYLFVTFVQIKIFIKK